MNARERRNARRQSMQPVSPAVLSIFRDAASGRPCNGARGAVVSWAVGDRGHSVPVARDPNEWTTEQSKAALR